MNNVSKNEYLSKIKPRYQKAKKLDKVTILDEFCSVCGYNRKYAIRKLNAKDPPKNKYKYRKRGPKTKYDHPDIERVLRSIWVKTNLPCSKRLKVILAIWLPHYPYYIPAEMENALLETNRSKQLDIYANIQSYIFDINRPLNPASHVHISEWVYLVRQAHMPDLKGVSYNPMKIIECWNWYWED